MNYQFIFDFQGIQALYGKKSTKTVYNPVVRPTTKPITPPTTETNEMCTNPKIDTIFNTPDGSTYAFKGSHYYKLTENAIAEGYPQLISEGWPGLPSKF